MERYYVHGVNISPDDRNIPANQNDQTGASAPVKVMAA
jgi:hypothetical protein